MSKILYLSASRFPGKQANSVHVMKMCSAFAKKQSVVLLGMKTQDHVSEENLFQRYGVRNHFDMFLIKEPRFLCTIWLSLFTLLLLFKRGNNISLVYGRTPLPCCVAAMMGYKVVYEAHTPISEMNSLARVLIPILFQMPNFLKLVVISEALKQFYVHKLSVDRIEIAHDGADLYLVGDGMDSLKKEKASKLHAGYVGHLYKGRGVELILRMAEKLPEVQFHIIGGREQDVSYYKSQAASKNIVFYGYVSQVEAQNYAHQCDVLLAPYQKDITIEGRICKAADYMSPLKIFEYMSHGKAILCSDFPVLREVLNKDCAMLLPWDSPDSWCLAMKTLLRDPLLMKRLGDKVLAKFVSQYTWEKRAESVLYGLK